MRNRKIFHILVAYIILRFIYAVNNDTWGCGQVNARMIRTYKFYADLFCPSKTTAVVLEGQNNEAPIY